MSETIMEDGKSGAARWTQESLQKLISSLKDTIPENVATQTYVRGLNSVDWDKVAFAPFSAEQCKEKWNSIIVKMRKYRSLPELLDEAEDVLSDPLHHKNIHPDFPKAPVPPKMAYIAKNISTYQKTHSGMTIGKIAQRASENFDKLSDEEKAKYTRTYRLEFNEYRRKKEKFCLDNELPLPRKRSFPGDGDEGCSKDEGPPKKPPGHGRALFLKEHSKAGGSSLGVSFLKVMGERWRKMSKKEKQDYNERCEKMKKEYKAKLAEYLDTLDEEEKQRMVKKKRTKKPKQILDRYVMQPGEPKRPSHSGFIYFYKEESSKILSQKGSMDLAKKKWHKLSAREKQRYAAVIEENMKKYTEDLQKWFQKLTPEEKKKYLQKKPSKLQLLQTCIDIKKDTLDNLSDSEEEEVVLSSVGRHEKDMLEVEESEDEEDV